MDAQTLTKLKDRYPTSSWAIWSQDFPHEGCLEDNPAEFYEFIKQKRSRLRPSIVLLSLNPSTKLPRDYQNFHSTDPTHRNDQFRDLVEEAGLEGAYMTDLVERVIDSNSANVDPTPEDVENLLEQLEILDQEKYYLICFHEKVFQALLEAFDTKTRDFPQDIRGFSTVQNDLSIEGYRVWFHANWGANKDKIPDLQNQLKFLSEEVVNGSLDDLSRWLNEPPDD